MTTFLDGPAKGEVLYLSRAPLLLRVTQNGIDFTGLDDIAANAEAADIIYIYQLTEKPTATVTRGTGIHPVARYKLCPLQPEFPPHRENPVRYYEGWRSWSRNTWEKLKTLQPTNTP